MSIVIGYDCTGDNVGSLPPGAQAAGYSTGSGGVPWTTQQFADRPGTLRICQDAGATDRTADYLDVETDAATVADCPGWVEKANANWDAGVRQGQRKPAIYVNGSNITAVANILTAADLSCGLIVANWNLDQAQAIAAVSAASGPFPVQGLQYADPGPYDIDVWSAAWLNEVSGPKPAPPGSKLWGRVKADEDIRVFGLRFGLAELDVLALNLTRISRALYYGTGRALPVGLELRVHA